MSHIEKENLRIHSFPKDPEESDFQLMLIVCTHPHRLGWAWPLHIRHQGQLWSFRRNTRRLKDDPNCHGAALYQPGPYAPGHDPFNEVEL